MHSIAVEITPKLEERLSNIEKLLMRLINDKGSASNDEVFTMSQMMAKFHVGKDTVNDWVGEGMVLRIGRKGSKSQRFKVLW
jgi:hypothetical protein